MISQVDWIKENGFTLKKARNRLYPAETITDADYADDLVLLTNKLVQAKSLLLSLEQAPRNIGLYMNSDKTKLMCFKQDGGISILNCQPLKFVTISHTLVAISHPQKNDVNIHLEKAWTAIDNLSTIEKSTYPPS